MKRILSVLLALVMIIGMLPMSILSASAAESSVTMNIYANKGTLSGTTISWTSEGVTFQNAKASSSTAIRTSDTDHYRLYVGSSVTITAPGNITKIVMVSTGSSYAIATTGSDGSVGTVSGSTITIVPKDASTTYTIPKISKQTRVKTLTVTYTDGASEGCAHEDVADTEAVPASCTATGYTAGVFCNDCETYIEGHELVGLIPHTETVTEEKAATCTEDGYTQYTCSVCENTRKVYIDATGHNYVDGICANEGCGLALPTDLAGKYYIAAIRSSGNYQYMTNNLDETSPRYLIVDSGATTLPESIEDIIEAQLFELIEVEGGYIIKTGEKYLGYTSGNSGTLVDEADAKVVTIEYSTKEGAYNIHFTAAADDERYLALNNNANSAFYAWYKGAGNQIQDLYLVPVSETAEVCEHTNTTTTTVDAKCDVAGSITVTCNDCGITVSTETIEALGHSYTDGVCDNCGEEEVIVPSEATITFDDATKRTEFTTEIQVWKENAVTVTNNKASSTSNVGNYVKPARFYKSSTVTVEYPGMTKIVFNCNNATYATALGNSITGATVTVNDKVVTVELANAVDSFTTGGMSAQVRVDSLTVYTTKVCDHVWGEPVLTTSPLCAVEGENTFTCTLCGETKKEAVAALGHVAADGFCSVCGGEFYTLATSLNEGDSVVLYNSENKVAMGVNTNSYGDKLLGVATNDATGLAVTEGMAVMKVKYVEGSETDFYLMLGDKYLTTGATGNSLVFAETADDYSKWYLEVPFEGDDVVLITNRNAVYNSNAQSIEYYNSAFTTYSRSTGKAYQMNLYVKAAPSVDVTHVSLDPTNDALGFKVQLNGIDPAEVTEYGVTFTVNGMSKTYKLEQAPNGESISARVQGIMEAGGGEMEITGQFYVIVNGEKIYSKQETTCMMDAIKAVNEITTLSDAQKAAICGLYKDYASVIDAWLGETNNIKDWATTVV